MNKMLKENEIERLHEQLNNYIEKKKEMQMDLICSITNIIPFEEIIMFYPMKDVGRFLLDYDGQFYLEECKKIYLKSEED